MTPVAEGEHRPSTGRPASSLSLETLAERVWNGSVDTVAVAFTDMQGRLQGKRVHAQHFLDDVVHHGTEGCNYLLAVDVEMTTVGGYAMSSWDTGYGDMVLRPDLATLHWQSWQPGTVGVLCDVLWESGEPVAASPRQILARQCAALEREGLVALVGTELEFIVFQDSFRQAWANGYRGLTPANDYNVDYSMLGTARVEPLLRAIRTAMATAGLTVESAKGECNLGQHEIAFRYREALTTCDNHAIYKTAAKEIADQQGMSLTFMAKLNEREGNSCHVHLSLRDLHGSPTLAADGEPDGLSAAGRSFIAGQLAHLPELTLLYAPNINSYKRFVAGSFAPTALRWGRDNRTCALRLVGHGPSLRLENRVPGGDVNPYLAVAGMIAAGWDGIRRGLPLEPAWVGNAYVSDSPRVVTSLSEALTAWESSAWVAETFGAAVQNHYANMARVELAAFGAAVTDWERVRCFERL